ncbi:Protein SERAC1, partial [Stegodyphus mimosarum]
MWKKKIILYAAAFTGSCYIFPWTNKLCTNHLQAVCDSPSVPELENVCSYIYLPENHGHEFYDAFSPTWYLSQQNIPSYWKLLMLSKCKDRAVRHQAIKALSEIPKLESWQYTMISQAADSRTSVGLARMPKVNTSFFLSPSFRDLEEESLQLELLLFLMALPIHGVDVCVQRLSKRAIIFANRLFEHEFTWDYELEDLTNIYHSQQKRKAVVTFHKLCLEAILAHSAVKSHKYIMVEKGVMKLLLKILKCHENDYQFQSLIAQILANFSLEEEFAKIFSVTGWIGILASWKISPYVEVNLPAAKALANLDKDDFHHSLYDSGVYLLHPHNRQGPRDHLADIIFVHGILGATFWTWRQHDHQRKSNMSSSEKQSKPDQDTDNESYNSLNYTLCWPKDWLARDFPNLRLISVDYNTCLSNWKSQCLQRKEKDSLDVKAKDILQKLLLSKIGERPIVWVAHSMGGLLVKQMLVEAAASTDEK